MKVAVLIPCFNEELSIAKVVRNFRSALPNATVYVYDNNSSDGTAAAARSAGAIVRNETLQGKGNVVRRMFADIDADIYVLTDGDDTYHAESAPGMIDRLVQENLDMVVGTRLHSRSERAFRAGHHFGNRLLTGIVTRIFGKGLADMLSGYRVFSRRFIKSFPSHSSGFEIETELTVHALEMLLPVAEVETPYAGRPVGSVSKLRTFRDGWFILKMIVRLFKDEKPLEFFSLIGLLLAMISVILAIPIFITFFETGLVPRLPTVVLATGVMLLAVLCMVCGIVLDTVSKGRREIKRLAYLNAGLFGHLSLSRDKVKDGMIEAP